MMNVSVCWVLSVFSPIKSLTRGPWGEKHHTAETWYEPFEEQGDINRVVSWVLGQGTIFLNTAGDVRILPRVLEAASLNLAKPSDGDMEELAKRTHMTRLFVG